MLGFKKQWLTIGGSLGTPIPTFHDAIIALSPIRYWRLADSTTTIVDEMLNQDGTLYGTEFYQDSLSLLTCDSSGSILAPSTTTSSDYIDCGVLSDSTGILSCSFFTKFNYEFASQYFFGNMSGNRDLNFGGFNLGFDSSSGNYDGRGNWVISIGDGVAYWEATSKPCMLMIDEIYHIYYCVNGDSVKLYVNGELVLEETSSITLSDADNTNNFTLFKPSTGASNYFYRGEMQDVAIFDKELSSEEVNNLYLYSTLCVNTPTISHDDYIDSLSPVSHWKFDEPEFTNSDNKWFSPTLKSSSITLSNSDKTIVSTDNAAWRNIYSDTVLSSGYTRYVEFVVDSLSPTDEFMFGFTQNNSTTDTTNFCEVVGSKSFGIYRKSNGDVVVKLQTPTNHEESCSITSISNGDVIGLALNYDSLSLRIYQNNILKQTQFIDESPYSAYNFTDKVYLACSVKETTTQITLNTLPLSSNDQQYDTPEHSSSWGYNHTIETAIDSINPTDSNYDCAYQRFTMTGQKGLGYGNGKCVNTRYSHGTGPYGKTVDNADFYNTTSGITIVATFRALQGNLSGTIIDKYVVDWGLDFSGGKLRFYSGNQVQNGVNVTNSTNPEPGVTYHVVAGHTAGTAGQASPNNDVFLYINGVEIGTRQNYDGRENNAGFGIGLLSTNLGSAPLTNAKVGTVAFFNKDLTASEIANLYSTFLTGELV